MRDLKVNTKNLCIPIPEFGGCPAISKASFSGGCEASPTEAQLCLIDSLRFGSKVFVRRAVRFVLRSVATLLATPFLLWFSLASVVFGKDAVLEGTSQALALIPGNTGVLVRAAFYSRVLSQCDPTVFLGFGTLVTKVDTKLGRNVFIGPYCQLGLVTLGDDTLLGPLVQIPSGPLRHTFDRTDVPIRSQPGHSQRISVGRDCWIGAGSVVMANVGEQSVVGAGSVVTKPIEPRQIAAGVPCKTIRPRV